MFYENQKMVRGCKIHCHLLNRLDDFHATAHGTTEESVSMVT